MLNITDWNINPNKDWYIKLLDTGSNISIQLYNSNADALAATNLVASGVADYGENTESILTMSINGTPLISYFNPAAHYHLHISGESGDDAKLYHLHPFVDIQEINNSVYRSEALTLRRVTNEINMHTHVSKNKTIALATLLDGIGIQDVITLDSDQRGQTSLNFVNEINISGTKNSLVSTIGLVEYIDFVR